MNEYKFINVFRAAAAFWVLAAHCLIWGGWYGIPLPSAKIAVDLFMLISGFLMAANTVARSDVEPLTEVRNRLRFWTRRYFRLAPAFYLALAVVVIGLPYIAAGATYLQTLNRDVFEAGGQYDPIHIKTDALNVFAHASFLSGVIPGRVLSGGLPDWSLSLEMQFYLIFPFIFLGIKRAQSALALGALVAAIGYLVAQRIDYPEPSLIVFKLNYFLAGMVLFYARSTSGAIAVGYAMAGLVLSSLGLEYKASNALGPLLFSAMLACAYMERSQTLPALLSKLFDSRVIRLMSNTSYSVYLFHGILIAIFGLMLKSSPFLQGFPPPARVLAMFVFVAPSAYFVGFIVFRYVEQPGILLGRRFTKLIKAPTPQRQLARQR